MRQLIVIGIGAGDPDHLTLQAVTALNEVDVFFHMDKGSEKDDLAQLRRDICARHITGRDYRFIEVRDPERDRTTPAYTAAVEKWHEDRAARYEQMMLDELADDGCGGFLVWGDPALYDSTLRVLDRLQARGNVAFTYRIVPGITSIQTLTAQHRIPLNRIGSSIQITTGRRLAQGLPPGVDDVVVMLDAHCTFTQLDEPDLEIYWGAYLGTKDEILLSGLLRDIGPEIVRVRAEARARKGWIMDSYLLRRSLDRIE
jgi:precorrin-6A synthase